MKMLAAWILRLPAARVLGEGRWELKAVIDADCHRQQLGALAVEIRVAYFVCCI